MASIALRSAAEKTTMIRRRPSLPKNSVSTSSAKSVSSVAAPATIYICPPAASPIPAVAHKLAAVVSPRTSCR